MKTESNNSLTREQIKFPLQASSNGRYLTDQDNKPFLYHADTGWLIFSNTTLEEAEEYLDIRRKQGFTVIQVMLLPLWSNLANRNGAGPFIEGDLTKPNEDYFRHVDQVLAMASGKGLAFILGTAFISCWDDYEFAWSAFLGRNGPEKCREYGRFLGKRYGRFPHVSWFTGGDRQPLELKEELRALALGIRETAPQQLITYHSTTSHSSTDEYSGEPWLDFSMTYTYFKGKKNAALKPEEFPEVYEVNRKEYQKQLMPFVLGEAMYEGTGGEVDNGSAYRIRRQAYWSLLSGSCGHAYGSCFWNFNPGWKTSLDSPGACHMKIFYDLFSIREWHLLKPDFEHDLIIDGYGTYSGSTYITAAGTENGKLMLAYIPMAPAAISVNLGKLQNGVRPYWFDPTSGCAFEAAGEAGKDAGVLRFNTPYDQNMAGDPDWVLILETGE